MLVRKLVSVAALLVIFVAGPSAEAAVVDFLGSVNTGVPGTLGSFPRNFRLTMTYTPGGGGSPASGMFTFPATPNGSVANPDVNPTSVIPMTGNLSVANDFGGNDIFTFGGQVAAGLLGANSVNFNFSFLNPDTTIDSPDATPENIAKLISGQTTISFSGGGGPGIFRGEGVIRGAPEPSTMIALTGLIAGGCGIGYRRRMKTKADTDSADEDN